MNSVFTAHRLDSLHGIEEPGNGSTLFVEGVAFDAPRIAEHGEPFALVAQVRDVTIELAAGKLLGIAGRHHQQVGHCPAQESTLGEGKEENEIRINLPSKYNNKKQRKLLTRINKRKQSLKAVDIAGLDAVE